MGNFLGFGKIRIPWANTCKTVCYQHINDIVMLKQCGTFLPLTAFSSSIILSKLLKFTLSILLRLLWSLVLHL